MPQSASAPEGSVVFVPKLLCVCCLSQEKTRSAVNLNKSVELTRAHLQAQLRNKEADNDRLTVQLRVLYPTVE